MTSSKCPKPILKVNPLGYAEYIDSVVIPSFEEGINLAPIELRQTTARNEKEAVLEFLNSYYGQEKTVLAFTKEVERFCLWLWYEKQLSLTDITDLHIKEYVQFITKPPASWSAEKRYRKFNLNGSVNDNWRVFSLNKSGDFGLSGQSVRLSKSTIDALFSYLVFRGFLRFSPFLKNKRSPTNNHSKKFDTFLRKEQVQFVLEMLRRELDESHDDDSVRFQLLRKIFIIKILFYTGLRISELADHSMACINGQNSKYFLSVIGKGGKPRDVDLSIQFMKSLADYRNACGYPSPYPTSSEKGFPLIAAESRKRNEAVDFKKSLSTKRIHMIIKDAFQFAAGKLREEASAEVGEIQSDMLKVASHIESASAHWLRHTRATYLIHSGEASEYEVMQQLGHADSGTLKIYLHALEERRSVIANLVTLEEI